MSACDVKLLMPDAVGILEEMVESVDFVQDERTATPKVTTTSISFVKGLVDKIFPDLVKISNKPSLSSIPTEFFEDKILLQGALEELGVITATAESIVTKFFPYRDAYHTSTWTETKDADNIYPLQNPLRMITQERMENKDKREVIPNQVLLAMMMASESWKLKNTSKFKFLSPFARGRFLYGQSHGKKLKPDELRELEKVEYTLTDIATSSGNIVAKLLGMSAVDKDNSEYLDGLIPALGMYAFSIEHHVKGSPIRVRYLRFAFDKFNSERNYNNNNQLLQIALEDEHLIKNDKKNREAVRELDTAMETLAEGVDSKEDTGILYSVAKNVATWIKGSKGGIPKKTRAIMSKLQKVVHTTSTATEDLIEIEQLKGGRAFLNGLMELVPEKGADGKNLLLVENYAVGVRAANEDKVGVLDLIIDTYKEHKENNDGAIEIFFKYALQVTHRLMQLGLLSPQNSKVARVFIQPAGTTLYTKENMHLFKLGILYNLGFSIDKKKPDAIIREFNKYLKDDVILAAVAAYNNRAEDGEAYMAAMTVVAKKMGSGLYTIPAIKHLSTYIDAVAKAKGDKTVNLAFESDITLEADAMTNGFAINALQFPLFAGGLDAMDEILNRVGIYFGEGIEHLSGGIYEGKTKLSDAYNVIAEYIEDFAHKKHFSDDKKEQAKYMVIEKAISEVFPLRQDNLSLKEMRELVKYPFMISQYAGGIEAIVNGITSDMIADIYKQINTMAVIYAGMSIEDRIAYVKDADGELQQLSKNLAILGVTFNDQGKVTAKETLAEYFPSNAKEIEGTYDQRVFAKEINIEEEGLRKVMLKQLTPRFKKALDKMLGESKLARNALVQIGEIQYAIFDVKFQKASAELLAEMNEKLKKEGLDELKSLPFGETAKLVKEQLLKIYPQYRGALIAASDEAFVDLTREVFAASESHVLIEVKDTVNGSSSTRNIHIKERKPSAPQVSALIRLVMHIDSSVLFEGLDAHPEVVPVYDGVVGLPETVEKFLKKYNKSFMEINRKESILENMYDQMKESLESLDPKEKREVDRWLSKHAFVKDKRGIGISLREAEEDIFEQMDTVKLARRALFAKMDKLGFSIHQMYMAARKLLTPNKKSHGDYFSDRKNYLLDKHEQLRRRMFIELVERTMPDLSEAVKEHISQLAQKMGTDEAFELLTNFDPATNLDEFIKLFEKVGANKDSDTVNSKSKAFNQLKEMLLPYVTAGVTINDLLATAIRNNGLGRGVTVIEEKLKRDPKKFKRITNLVNRVKDDATGLFNPIARYESTDKATEKANKATEEFFKDMEESDAQFELDLDALNKEAHGSSFVTETEKLIAIAAKVAAEEAEKENESATPGSSSGAFTNATPTLETTVTLKSIRSLAERYTKLSNDDAEHTEQLNGILDTIAKVLEEIGSITLSEFQVDEATIGKWREATNNVKIGLSRSMPASTTEQSPHVIYTHELIHAVTWHALKNNPVLKKQLQKIYDRTRKTLEADSNGGYKVFLNVAEGQEASAADIQSAKEQYNYLFHDTKAKERLAEFLAIGLTNSSFSKYLRTGSVARIKQGTGIFAGLMHALSLAVDFFVRTVTMNAMPNATDSNAYMDTVAIFEQLITIQSKNEGRLAAIQSKLAAVQGKLDKGTDFLDGKIIQFLKDQYKLVAEAERTGRIRVAVADTVGSVKLAISEDERAMKIMTDVNRIFGATMRSLFNEVGQGSLTTRWKNLLMKGGSIIHKARQVISAQYRTAIANNDRWKSTKFEDIVSTTRQAMTDVFYRTNLSDLIHAGYSHAEIAAFIKDPSLVKATMDKIRDIKLGHKATDDVMKYADDLGRYMATGITDPNMWLPHDNVYTIARDYNNAMHNDAKYLADLSAYTALKALSKTNIIKLAVVSELVAAEMAEDSESNGFINIIDFHRAFVEQIKEREYGSTLNPFPYQAGWVKERADNFHSVVYGRSEDADMMYNLGYTLPEPVADISGIKQYHDTRYVSSTKPNTTFVSGIMSMTNETLEGRTLRDILAANPEFTDRHGEINYLGIHETIDLILRAHEKQFRETGKVLQFPVRPVRNGQGNINDYRVTSSHQERERMYAPSLEIQDVFANMHSSMEDQEATVRVNEEAVLILVEEWQERYLEEPELFVDLFSGKYYEYFLRLPRPLKFYIQKFSVRGKFMVREDIIDKVFGYHMPSIANIKWLKDNKHPRLRRAVELFEFILRETVSYAKDRIVIATPQVGINNILSNITQLDIRKIPFSYTARKIREGYSEYTKISADMERARELQAEVLAKRLHRVNSPEAKELAVIMSDITENKLFRYTIAGLNTIIAEDLSEASSSGLYKRIEKDVANSKLGEFINELPEGITTSVAGLARFFFISKSTALYKAFRHVVQLSDFMSRYVLMEYGMEVEGKTFDQVMPDAVDAFVLFDENLTPAVAVMDSFGLLMFTTYYLRNNRVVVDLFKKYPTRATFILGAEASLGMYSTSNLINAPITGNAPSILPVGNIYRKVTGVAMWDMVN